MASVFLILAISLSCIVQTNAHGREKHDEELEYILFGSKHYKNSHPDDKRNIQSIEDALYLCVDQFNGNGSDELENLVKIEKIPDIPKTIDEIDYKSNYSHRSLTHRGWNQVYDKKAHWSERQKILRNTVKKKLFPSLLSPVSKVKEKIKGKSNEALQCESFCTFLYCIHILGDHIEAGENERLGGSETGSKTIKQKIDGLAYIDPLAHTHDIRTPGVIPDMIKSCEVIFQSQTNTFRYKALIQELKYLRDKCEDVYYSDGGVNDEAKFEEYNGYANELLEILSLYIPPMLKNEEFFLNTFYK